MHKLKDLDETFKALEKVAKAVVKGKYGSLRYRHEYKIIHMYPMLEHIMLRAKKGWIMITIGSVGQHYRSIYHPTWPTYRPRLNRVSVKYRSSIGRYIDGSVCRPMRF